MVGLCLKELLCSQDVVGSKCPWPRLHELTLKLGALEQLLGQTPVEDLKALKGADYLERLLNQVVGLRELPELCEARLCELLNALLNLFERLLEVLPRQLLAEALDDLLLKLVGFHLLPRRRQRDRSILQHRLRLIRHERGVHLALVHHQTVLHGVGAAVVGGTSASVELHLRHFSLHHR